MTSRRSVIVHIATSADGYIARPDGDIAWLTSRPKPEGFYGLPAFIQSVDTKLLGRKTYDLGRRMGATVDSSRRTVVFSRHPPPADAPAGVEFVSGAIGSFVSRLRAQPGKDIWLMGGGELIASFLDEGAIDRFVISVVPVLIGDGIPLIARRHRHVLLDLDSVERFGDGVVQLHYCVRAVPDATTQRASLLVPLASAWHYEPGRAACCVARRVVERRAVQVGWSWPSRCTTRSSIRPAECLDRRYAAASPGAQRLAAWSRSARSISGRPTAVRNAW
jgi:dihydrofolate reductase